MSKKTKLLVWRSAPYFYNFANTKNERLFLYGILSFVFQDILKSRTNSREVCQKSVFQMTRKTVVVYNVGNYPDYWVPLSSVWVPFGFPRKKWVPFINMHNGRVHDVIYCYKLGFLHTNEVSSYLGKNGFLHTNVDFLHTNLDFPHTNVDFLHTNSV